MSGPGVGKSCGRCGGQVCGGTCVQCGKIPSPERDSSPVNRLELPSFSDVMPEREATTVSKWAVAAVALGIAVSIGFLILLSRIL